MYIDGLDQALRLFIGPQQSAVPLTIVGADKTPLTRLLDLLVTLAIALPRHGWPHNLVDFGNLRHSNLI